MKNIDDYELLDQTVVLTVEIGNARCSIEEILEFGKGTLVTLEQFAGDPVYVYANDKLIAKGDIVIVDDNLGIKITEII